MGNGATLRRQCSRPSSTLQGSSGCPHEKHGDRRSGRGSAIALAESICGTTDRIDSARVPGSRHCVEREVAAADSAKLFSVLREVAHASSPGERRPEAEGRLKDDSCSCGPHEKKPRNNPAPPLRTLQGRFNIFASAGQRALWRKSLASGSTSKLRTAASRCSIAFSAQSAAWSISEPTRW